MAGKGGHGGGGVRIYSWGLLGEVRAQWSRIGERAAGLSFLWFGRQGVQGACVNPIV